MEQEKSDEQQIIDRKVKVAEQIDECLGSHNPNEIKQHLNEAKLAGLNREYYRLEKLLEDVRDDE